MYLQFIKKMNGTDPSVSMEKNKENVKKKTFIK